MKTKNTFKFKDEFLEARTVLEKFVENDDNFIALEKAGKILVESLSKGGKVLACGNGGSMCDAMHFAEELTGRYRDERPSIPAIAISDSSHISCAANDYGFDYIFSRYIDGLGKKGDVLVAISTSGNSANIINAVESAREKGMKSIALTGKKGGELAKICDVEIRAPHSGYSDRIQEIHIKVIHTLINYIEKNMY